jgi:flavorubredoxin
MTMTRIHEVADGIYRVNTPIDLPNGAFSFNQYLIVDEAPLLFHTGGRRLFPQVRDAVAKVMDPSKLRYVAFSHFESDECGSLNEWLATAPEAQPVCSTVAALVSVNDMADRPARALADGETLALGRRTVRWLDTPHLPHGWETGYLFEESTSTLFCGDLFTQPGRGDDAVTESDILGPSEAFRAQMDYFSATKNVSSLIAKLAATNPATLACMHGSTWRGDGAALLTELGRQLNGDRG